MYFSSPFLGMMGRRGICLLPYYGQGIKIYTELPREHHQCFLLIFSAVPFFVYYLRKRILYSLWSWPPTVSGKFIMYLLSNFICCKFAAELHTKVYAWCSRSGYYLNKPTNVRIEESIISCLQCICKTSYVIQNHIFYIHFHMSRKAGLELR